MSSDHLSFCGSVTLDPVDAGEGEQVHKKKKQKGGQPAVARPICDTCGNPITGEPFPCPSSLHILHVHDWCRDSCCEDFDPEAPPVCDLPAVHHSGSDPADLTRQLLGTSPDQVRTEPLAGTLNHASASAPIQYDHSERHSSFFVPLIQAAWPGYPSPHPRWPAPALPADDWNSLVTAYEVDFSARRLPPPFRPDGYVHPRTQEALLFSTAVIPHGQSLVPVDILQLLIRSALDLRSIAPYRSPSSLPLVSQIPVGTPTPPREDPSTPSFLCQSGLFQHRLGT